MSLHVLSEREREIAIMVATGASNKEIARHLAISIKTVKNTLTHVFVKTGTRSRTELAVQLVRAEITGRNAEYLPSTPLWSTASL